MGTVLPGWSGDWIAHLSVSRPRTAKANLIPHLELTWPGTSGGLSSVSRHRTFEELRVSVDQGRPVDSCGSLTTSSDQAQTNGAERVPFVFQASSLLPSLHLKPRNPSIARMMTIAPTHKRCCSLCCPPSQKIPPQCAVRLALGPSRPVKEAEHHWQAPTCKHERMPG